ncbi:hypothetical protein BpHYR1_046019 [Brachionus plicatilis]|uniref:Uncharacterized protein n=1 Tax=Brachionus plicatilis TaxID=10195 RepID=A0A3M7QXW4_BRAPC|nr:hypothetical protein BpHYR1_046019 [Brachionus plicatilis]
MSTKKQFFYRASFLKSISKNNYIDRIKNQDLKVRTLTCFWLVKTFFPDFCTSLVLNPGCYRNEK